VTALWLRHLFVTPPVNARFRSIERRCRWIGTHDVHWTSTVRGDALVGQCARCRVVVSVVVQSPASDWPGCVD
jgi:hypothetical protein